MIRMSYSNAITVLVIFLFVQVTMINARSRISTEIVPEIQKFLRNNTMHIEGDMILPNRPVVLRGGGNSMRWNGRVIPYTLPRNVANFARNVIQNAMQDIESKTCIRFTPRSNQRDYVSIQMNNGGCWSYVGRTGGAQGLNLGPGCIQRTTIIHELVHAIGFVHEQCRSDRDNWINIHWDNIRPNFVSEFRRIPRTNNFGTEYDYRSVMHYRYNAGARDWRKPTITTKRDFSLRLLGRGDDSGGLTTTDALQINRMHNC